MELWTGQFSCIKVMSFFCADISLSSEFDASSAAMLSYVSSEILHSRRCVAQASWLFHTSIMVRCSAWPMKKLYEQIKDKTTRMLTGAIKSSQLQEISCFQNCMGTREEVVKKIYVCI
jgi:hypothetical protein